MSEGPTSTGGPGGSEGAGGHAEGEWLPDATGGHQYRYHVHGQPTDFVSDSGVESMDQHAEWRADPAGRHQYRYFVRSQATQAVSDNGVQSTDPIALPDQGAVGAPPPAGGDSAPLRPYLVGGGVIAVLVIVTALIVLVLTRGSDNASPTTAASTPTTTSPVCTSGEGFTYQVGACVTGSGSADIGPFTTPGAWGFEIDFSGQTAGGADCATVGEVITVWDLASRQGDQYTTTLTAVFGNGSVSVPASTEPDTEEAGWRITFDNVEQCSWTLTISR